jgi:hypothetical protein
MEVLHIKKGAQLPNTLESFHIYDLRRQELQMNSAFTDIRNSISDIIIKYTHHDKYAFRKSSVTPHPHPSLSIT